MVCWWISTTVEAAVAVEVAKEACQEYNVAASLGKRKGIQGIEKKTTTNNYESRPLIQ